VNETVTVALTPSTGYAIGSSNSATVTLVSDETVTQTVTVTATTPPHRGGPDAGTFTFTRVGSTASALTVSFTVGGTATAGAITSLLAPAS